MNQLDTPLANRFFSNGNVNLIQQGLANEIRNRTGGINIDRQNTDDLALIMRQIYITNVFNPYGQLVEQVNFLNKQVLQMTTSQVMTGLSQYIGYLRDSTRQPMPLHQPVSTSTYGNKMPFNNKIGL
tara:strand:- start:1226 stop:1606 length:381 start_codon:yes stop_codon:yes gene_type:complete